MNWEHSPLFYASMSKFWVYTLYCFGEISTSKFKSFRKFPILLTTDLRLLTYFVIFMQKTIFLKLFFFRKLVWNVSESSDPSVKFCPFTLLANVPLQYFSLLISYVNEFTESSRWYYI